MLIIAAFLLVVTLVSTALAENSFTETSSISSATEVDDTTSSNTHTDPNNSATLVTISGIVIIVCTGWYIYNHSALVKKDIQAI